ncbi:MAG: hypothetical protein KDC54_17580 [Lewinella sp.]|nr:hypothetical protein [Lewinella sp.]
MARLLTALREHELSVETEEFINGHIASVNAFSSSDKDLRNVLAKAHQSILQRLEKAHHLVPPGRYTGMWMALGMAAFGVPLGVSFGLALDNMALLSIGLPIGLAIGLAIGAGLDEKAKKEGRQLAVAEA